jgi:hypothetical protein
MTTKRRPLNRSQHPPITPEMIELFERGTAILEAGDHERWEDDPQPGRRREYLDVNKRLNITLLKQGWHQESVLSPRLDHRMPAYMTSLASGRDWHLSQGWRRSLMEELRHREQIDAAIVASNAIKKHEKA